MVKQKELVRRDQPMKFSQQNKSLDVRNFNTQIDQSPFCKNKQSNFNPRFNFSKSPYLTKYKGGNHTTTNHSDQNQYHFHQDHNDDDEFGMGQRFTNLSNYTKQKNINLYLQNDLISMQIQDKINKSVDYEKQVSILNIDDNHDKRSSQRKKRAVLYIQPIKYDQLKEQHTPQQELLDEDFNSTPKSNETEILIGAKNMLIDDEDIQVKTQKTITEHSSPDKILIKNLLQKRSEQQSQSIQQMMSSKLSKQNYINSQQQKSPAQVKSVQATPLTNPKIQQHNQEGQTNVFIFNININNNSSTTMQPERNMRKTVSRLIQQNQQQFNNNTEQQKRFYTHQNQQKQMSNSSSPQKVLKTSSKDQATIYAPILENKFSEAENQIRQSNEFVKNTYFNSIEGDQFQYPKFQTFFRTDNKKSNKIFENLDPDHQRKISPYQNAKPKLKNLVSFNKSSDNIQSSPQNSSLSPPKKFQMQQQINTTQSNFQTINNMVNQNQQIDSIKYGKVLERNKGKNLIIVPSIQYLQDKKAQDYKFYPHSNKLNLVSLSAMKRNNNKNNNSNLESNQCSTIGLASYQQI